MFKKDVTVTYGDNGVCRIVDIRKEDFGGSVAEYYILQPRQNNRSVIYVPVENQRLTAKMKLMLSEDEIYALLKSTAGSEIPWIQDDKERKEKYNEIVSNGEREDLIKIIKTLYHHKEDLTACGKKLHNADEIIMHRAEKIIYDEFSEVLDININEVADFINKTVANY